MRVGFSSETNSAARSYLLDDHRHKEILLEYCASAHMSLVYVSAGCTLVYIYLCVRPERVQELRCEVEH